MPDGGGRLDVEVTRDLDALERLAPEWDELCDRAEHVTPFQRPDWLLPWWRHLGGGALVTVALRDGGRLVALAPLFAFGAPAPRTVALLGAGVSDYGDVIVERGREAEALPAIFDHVTDYDALHFDALAPHAALLSAGAPTGFDERRDAQDPCSVLRLDPRAIPPHQLARARKYRRRAERLGAVELHVADASTRAARTADLFRLHEARWRARGEPGVLAGEPLRRFHEDVGARFVARGALRLFALTIGGAAAALLYGFVERRCLYCYLQAFDPSYAEVSPGMLVLAAVLDHAAGEGLAEVDFLRGREEYKRAWGGQERPLVRRVLTASRRRR